MICLSCLSYTEEASLPSYFVLCAASMLQGAFIADHAFAMSVVVQRWQIDTANNILVPAGHSQMTYANKRDVSGREQALSWPTQASSRLLAPLHAENVPS